RIGIFCLDLGILVSPPFLDLLPVNSLAFWQHGDSVFFRVVRVEEEQWAADVAMVIVGVVLLGAGLLARRFRN
ncbi:MAG: hypothetical protein ABIT83_05590, partial [Massilia sp.]